MTTKRIYAHGRASVLVPALSSIAVFTKGSASVKAQVGYPNIPDSYDEVGPVTAKETVFGAYAVPTIVKIEADVEEVLYNVGVTPIISVPKTVKGQVGQYQPVPATKTVAALFTIAELLTKIIVATPTATGATVAYTLPVASLITAALPEMAIGDSFDWTIINKALAAADTITITAPDATHLLEGVSIIQSLHTTIASVSGNCASFRTKKTAAAVYTTYRLT